MFFQFMESDEEADRIMPSGACKAEQERQVGFQFAVIAGELEECIAKVILIKVAVPSPGSIRVREMAHVFGSPFPMAATWAGVGVDGSTISGNSKVFSGDKAAFDGRKDGSMEKEEL